MRPSSLLFAMLLVAGAFSFGAAAVRAGDATGAAAVRAGDATLFYAPPDTAPVPPLVVDGHGAPQHLDPPHGRVCFGQAETRERIATHKLTEPLQALRTGSLQGDALRAKLCRWKPGEFVYEIAVLRRDGRIVHVYMNAQNGLRVGP